MSIEPVAIVVVNYKEPEVTLECIKALEGQTYGNFHIVVVENGSNDESEQMFKEAEKRFKAVTFIYSSANLGFTGGNNLGFQWAKDNHYHFVALLNNDAIPQADWLKELTAAMKSDDGLAIVTGLLLHEDGKTIDSTGEQYSQWGLAFPRNRGQLTNKAHDSGLIFGATGGASLYRMSALDEVGMFDQAFFCYYEDIDLSFRLQLQSWNISYNSRAIAYHKQGLTSGKIPGFTIRQAFTNLPLLFLKNVPRELLFPIGIRFYFAYLLMLLNAVKNGNGSHAFKGAWKSIVLTPNALRKRRHIQQTKKVPTSYIKSMLWPDLPPDQTGIRRLRKFFTGKP